MPTTSKEGVITIYNDQKELIAIIRKDMESRKNIIYNVSESSLDEIEALIKADVAIPQ